MVAVNPSRFTPNTAICSPCMFQFSRIGQHEDLVIKETDVRYVPLHVRSENVSMLAKL